jgi:hypothetical protein
MAARPSVRQIFENMPQRYLPGKVDRMRTWYFSVGSEKWSVTLSPTAAVAEEGRTAEKADSVLVCDPELFTRMVLDGKRPGALDIARGKIKTNDPTGLAKMVELFRFEG